MSGLPSHLKPIIVIKTTEQSCRWSETHPTHFSASPRKRGKIEPTINPSIIRQDTTAALPWIYRKSRGLPRISPPQSARNPKTRKRSSKGTLIVLARECKSIIQTKLIRIVYSSKPTSQRDQPISMRLPMDMEYSGIWSHNSLLRIYLRYIRMKLKILN
jgi:hypothetical protein